MATTAKSKKSSSIRTKSAFADESFYEQLRNGGERGWNDVYIDAKDAASGEQRFYLKFYGAAIASVEIVDKDDEKQTKITVFGSSDKTPVSADRAIAEEEWSKLFDEVILAIQSLYQS